MSEHARLPEHTKSFPADLYQPSLSPARENPAPLRGGAYDPGRLLDNVAHALHMSDDAQLADALELPALLLAKIRQRKRRVGASVFMRMQELTGTPISTLKQLLGERRGRYRVEWAQR